jgi:hypothetical protein
VANVFSLLTRTCMCLPKAVAVLNCLLIMTLWSRGSRKFVLFVDKTTHVFARGGGIFEVFCRKRNLLFRGAASL